MTNYEEVLAAARSYEPTLPEMPPVRAPKAPWNGRTVVVAAGIAMMVYGFAGLWLDCLILGGVNSYAVSWSLLAPLCVSLVCALLFRRRTFRAQLMLRALLWSNLIIGLIMALFIALRTSGASGAFVGVGAGISLFAALGEPLDELPDPSFRPSAYFGRLAAALAMAAADAHTLAFCALSTLDGLTEPFWYLRSGMNPLWHLEGFISSLLLCVGALVMGTVVWGLLRLKTWAVFVNILANFAIAGLALQGIVYVSIPVAGALATTAAVQLLLPVPLLAAAVGRRPPPEKWTHRGLARATVVGLALLSALGISHSRPLSKHPWIEDRTVAPDPDMTRRRGAPRLSSPKRAGGVVEWKDPPELVNGELVGHAARCDLRGHDWRNRTWRGEHRSDRWISRPELADCVANGLDARNGRWINAYVGRTDFTGASLGGLEAVGSMWNETNLERVDLRRSDLEGSLFIDARLEGARLDKANLRSATILADGTGPVSFRGADLTDARLEGLDAMTVDWTGAICPDGSLADDHGSTCEGQALERTAWDGGVFYSRLESAEGWAEFIVLGLADHPVSEPYRHDRRFRPGDAVMVVRSWEGRGRPFRSLLFPWITTHSMGEGTRQFILPLIPTDGMWTQLGVFNADSRLGFVEGRLVGAWNGRVLHFEERVPLALYSMLPVLFELGDGGATGAPWKVAPPSP